MWPFLKEHTFLEVNVYFYFIKKDSGRPYCGKAPVNLIW